MKTGRALSVLSLSLGLCVAVIPGGAQQPLRQSLPPNTWVNLQAGGVAGGSGVGDEGYSTFVYAPGLRKALVWGKYHAYQMNWGEDQNALLAYDLVANRWDVIEITEDAWSEFLPGVGHDQGNAAIDPRQDLYITRGNMTLHGNTAYQTYTYDLRAGRGRRMLPSRGPSLLAHEVASGFDPDRGVMLVTRGASALYDPDKNVWTDLPNSPSDRAAPGLAFDSTRRVFVMFGGGASNETWIFDAGSRSWRRRNPPVSPSARRGASMAFDPESGLTLLVGGIRPGGDDHLSDMWAYDVESDRWMPLATTAPPNTVQAVNSLVYHAAERVFLLKDISDLRKVYALRFAPPTPNR